MSDNNEQTAVKLDLYRWAGKWGPFKVNIPCGECALTTDIINDTLNNELDGIRVDLSIQDWLSNWWRPLPAGGWHAPIVLVDGKLVSQGVALNRGVLTEAIIAAHAKKTNLEGHVLFGKDNCKYCRTAKELLSHHGIEYIYHDVVKNPRALYDMLARVKPIVGPKTPITTPQIWLDGKYIGGADKLEEKLNMHSKDMAA